jgi:hypothetical protein
MQQLDMQKLYAVNNSNYMQQQCATGTAVSITTGCQ